MGAGIDNTVVFTVVGQVGITGIKVSILYREGKLKDFHARESIGKPEFINIIGNYSQVLSNDGKLFP